MRSALAKSALASVRFCIVWKAYVVVVCSYAIRCWLCQGFFAPGVLGQHGHEGVGEFGAGEVGVGEVCVNEVGVGEIGVG